MLFLILKKLGYPWAEELFHLSYGMVDLPSGKMKSREGTVVDADDLMDEVVQEARKAGEELSKLDGFSDEEKARLFEQIGLAALKYFLLKVDPKKRMLFDPAASIDLQGHTGALHPVHLRPHTKPVAQGGRAGCQARGGRKLSLGPGEREVIKLLHHLPTVLRRPPTVTTPAAWPATYRELVKAYNTFYQGTPVLKEEDAAVQDMRLALSQAVARPPAKRCGAWELRVAGADAPACPGLDAGSSRGRRRPGGRGRSRIA